MRHSRLTIGIFVFSAISIFVIVYPQLSYWYYVRVKGVSEAIRNYMYLDSTSACIPAEHALAFIDSNNIAGFILFEKMEYSQVDYVVKMFDQQTEKIQKGRLTTWKKWPWSKHSLRSAHVYIGDEEYPHFAWLPPFCFLHFDRSKILKVCLVPLNKVHEALENKDSEQWIDTDYIGDGSVGRGTAD
jgi:hypothetical protein